MPETASSEVTFAVRIATLYLTVNKPTDPLKLHRAVEAALENDARVVSVDVVQVLPDPGPNAWQARQLYDPRAAGERMIQHQRIRGIGFVVDVPMQDQRRFQSDDPPSNRYCAQWDGRNLVIAWPHSGGTVNTRSGGHVVLDVLRDAAAASNALAVHQACSAGCEYELNHTTLIATASPDHTRRLTLGPLLHRERVELSMRSISPSASLADYVERIASDIGPSMSLFAVMSNMGMHVNALTTFALKTADEALLLQLRHDSPRTGKLRSRLRAAWNQRNWRRQTRALVSKLWLSINRIESAKRRYLSTRRSFELSMFAIEGLELLFQSDSDHNQIDLDTMDLTALHAEAETVVARIDNEQIRRATWVAGLVGGAAGAMASIFVSVLN